MSQRLWDDLSEGFGNRGIIRGFLETVLKGPEKPRTATAAGLPSGFHEAPYIYKPLPYDAKSVFMRLLELLPSSRKDSHVECRLTHHRLAECQGRYESLSYVWGDTRKPVTLWVDGQSFPVGQNLYQALVDLRHQNKTRVLWVDAVCINQAIDAERNQQVAAMAQIYRGASHTVVYLGPAFKTDTPSAYALIEKLATEALAVRTGLEDTITISTLSQGPSVKSKWSRQDTKAVDTSKLAHLGLSPWWERAWTAQEVLLAPKALVVTGTCSIEWERFCIGVNFGLRAGIIDAVLAGMLVLPVILPYLSTQALRDELYRSSASDDDDDDDEEATTASAQRLLALLIQSRSRHATNPRDKIYAYLGMSSVVTSTPNFLGVESNILGIEPNYAAPVENIYRDAAQRIILYSHRVDVLGACLPGVSPGLPTWVPDWNNTGPAPRPFMYDTFGERRTSQISFSSSWTPNFQDNYQTLVLSGHHITSVRSLSRVLPRPIISMDDIHEWIPKDMGYSRLMLLVRLLLFLPLLLARLWDMYQIFLSAVTQLVILAELERFARETPLSNPIAPQDTNEDDDFFVYWRTISAGAGGVKGRSEASRLFYAWRGEHRLLFRLCALRIHKVLPSLLLFLYLRTTWSHYSAFMRYLEMAYERRLGRCSNGYLALLPAGAQAGDRIVLVEQGRVPLLLRPEKEGTGYRLVGEAYVEGIMAGEAFKREECMELLIH